jgi:hypothetical protein
MPGEHLLHSYFPTNFQHMSFSIHDLTFHTKPAHFFQSTMEIPHSFGSPSSITPMDFLGLPAVNRYLIYKQLFRNFVLTRRGTMNIGCGFPSILHSNREIRNESMPVFYRMTNFNLSSQPPGYEARSDKSVQYFNPTQLPQLPQYQINRQIQHAVINVFKNSLHLSQWSSFQKIVSDLEISSLLPN